MLTPGIAQGTFQFEPLAVVASKADDDDFTDSEGGKVVDDGARTAGLGADVDHVVDGQAGLDGGLDMGRIDLEVTVEAEVADHGQAHAGIPGGERLKAIGIHHACNSR